MAGSNFKCKICGKEYRCCDMGLKKFPYKQIVCSEECWQEWLSKINKNNKVADINAVEEPVVEIMEPANNTSEDVQPAAPESDPVIRTKARKAK